jgi:hypothetical protein
MLNTALLSAISIDLSLWSAKALRHAARPLY